MVEGHRRAAATRAVAQPGGIDARVHLNRWRITGVWPLGAQVRRVTGSSEAP
jgi:hypothetical protein